MVVYLESSANSPDAEQRLNALNTGLALAVILLR